MTQGSNADFMDGGLYLLYLFLQVIYHREPIAYSVDTKLECQLGEENMEKHQVRLTVHILKSVIVDG
jgi:hypothetical protein